MQTIQHFTCQESFWSYLEKILRVKDILLPDSEIKCKIKCSLLAGIRILLAYKYYIKYYLFIVIKHQYVCTSDFPVSFLSFMWHGSNIFFCGLFSNFNSATSFGHLLSKTLFLYRRQVRPCMFSQIISKNQIKLFPPSYGKIKAIT